MRGDIAVMFQDEMDMTMRFDGGADCSRQLVEPVGLGDRMGRIEAQSVEAILHQPIQRVLGEIAPHFRPAKVDRPAPRCLHLIPKELRSIACEIIPVRSEVVVDDVEKNHQPMHVRRIDESLELIGRAVTMIGSKRQHTVVPPVSSAWKIAHRHQLNGRDAELLELWKLAWYAGEAA